MANKKNVWSPEEEELLFSLHAAKGSKWATIAGSLPAKDQCSIKNKFYSTLRKGHRKINSYITEIKRKSDPVRHRAYKTIQDIFISKLIAVVDGSYEQKYEVKPTAVALAADIQKTLIYIARSDREYQQKTNDNYNMEEDLLQKILEFNKNCKKRKGKRASDKRKIIKDEEELMESQYITDSKQDGIKLQEKSEKSLQINVKTQAQVKASAQPQPFSFINCIQRKESTSKIFPNFSNMATDFIKYCEYFAPAQEQNLIQSTNNMTHSGFLKEEKNSNWMFQSTSSRQSLAVLPKRISNYLTEPSPSPNDPYSPFTFNNIMKNKNITSSNIIDDRISCNEEEFANSGIYKKDADGSFINLLPLAKTKTGEFLIKSADLKREIIEETPPMSTSMNMEKDPIPTFSSLFPNIDERHFNNNRSYVSEYAFEPNNAQPIHESVLTTFTEGVREQKSPQQ